MGAAVAEGLLELDSLAEDAALVVACRRWAEVAERGTADIGEEEE
jgi:hypothetical protein